MVSKADIKFIQSLIQKKYRKKNQLFVAEGVKLVNEILFSELEIHRIYGNENWLEENTDKLTKSQKAKCVKISDRELSQISFQKNPNDVLATVYIPEYSFADDPQLVLMLDSIRDPGNLGTILRIADWYNIKQIICTEDCVDVYNPKVVQATMGSIARIRTFYENPHTFIEEHPEYTIYATTLNGKDVHKINISKPAIILIGNEAAGIHMDLIEKAHQSISIPRYGQAESLNAAVATGIILDQLIAGMQ